MDFTLVKDEDGLAEVARRLDKTKVAGVDLETTTISPLDGEIRLMSINAGGKIFVVDLFHTAGRLGPVLNSLRRKDLIKVFHNAKFDQKWLYHKYGLELWPVFDTYRASRLIYNGISGIAHDLWSVMLMELDELPKSEDLQKSDWSGELSEKQYQYSAEDVVPLPALREAQLKKLKENGLLRSALIEFEVLLPEGVVELTGIPVNVGRWMEAYEEAKKRSEEALATLSSMCGGVGNQGDLPGMGGSGINFNSPKQVLEVLNKLGVPATATNAIELSKFKGKHKVVDALLEYRKWSKRCQAFGPDYLVNVRSDTGRIHADYFGFTHAGRYSCSNPNLQQIPRDPMYRRCFSPPEGRALVGADYSGIELRIIAEIANDKTMIEVFKRGGDVHIATAALTSGKKESEITKEERQRAKAVNFGLCYGMGADKLMVYARANYGVEMSKAEAVRMRDAYFRAYSGIKRWHKQQISRMKREKMVRTLSGRLRYLDPDKHYNEALNTPVQGTGSDAIKMSLKAVFEGLRSIPGAKIVHHVHDEILVECNDNPEEIRAVKGILETGMKTSMEKMLKKVPVEVEATSGESWADLK